MSTAADGYQSENVILAAIPPEEFQGLLPLLEPYILRKRETLHEAGEDSEWVYFPTRGIISVLTVLANGKTVEFATVGREGCTGVPSIVGMPDAALAFVSQTPGEAMRIRRGDFLESMDRSPLFAAAMRAYAGVMFAFLAQSAACNRAHHLDQRCARWLLMTHDQAGGGDFPVTHESLAQMLGASRPSVARAAAALQSAGLISYHRGQMQIIDREALEVASCECYRVLAGHFDRVRALRQ